MSATLTWKSSRSESGVGLGFAVPEIRMLDGLPQVSMTVFYRDRHLDLDNVLLDTGSAPNPQGRTIAFARLFRGAARYALYLRDGEGDDSARELAAADLRECRRHEGAFTPSATYFSPRFIQFYSVVTAD